MKRFLFDMLTLTLGLCFLLIIGAFIEGSLTLFMALGLALTTIACARLSHIESTRKTRKLSHSKTAKKRSLSPSIVAAKTNSHKKPAHAHLKVA